MAFIIVVVGKSWEFFIRTSVSWAEFFYSRGSQGEEEDTELPKAKPTYSYANQFPVEQYIRHKTVSTTAMYSFNLHAQVIPIHLWHIPSFSEVAVWLDLISSFGVSPFHPFVTNDESCLSAAFHFSSVVYTYCWRLRRFARWVYLTNFVAVIVNHK